MKHEFHKLVLERQKEKLAAKKREEEQAKDKENSEDVEKVLQPILEQITDDTEGLLLQDLKQRWFKISLCTSEEIEEQQKIEAQENEDEIEESDKNNNSV